MCLWSRSPHCVQISRDAFDPWNRCYFHGNTAFSCLSSSLWFMLSQLRIGVKSAGLKSKTQDDLIFKVLHTRKNPDQVHCCTWALGDPRNFPPAPASWAHRPHCPSEDGVSLCREHLFFHSEFRVVQLLSSGLTTGSTAKSLNRTKTTEWPPDRPRNPRSCHGDGPLDPSLSNGPLSLLVSITHTVARWRRKPKVREGKHDHCW